MAGGTISDWIIEARKKGLEDLANAFHSKKLEDYARLRESGLPIFDDFMTPYSQFSRDNAALMKFLSKYPGFCIRAIPDTKELPRRFEVGVKSFEDCQKFLEENVLPEKKDNYTVLINEYGQDKPANLSGIIISNDRGVRIEVGECGLDELSHGADPSASCVIDLTGLGHVSDKTYWEKRNPKDEKLIQEALDYLELSRDSFNPYFMRGYFEFIVVGKGQIRFLDYKVNEMYLK